ncbi:hypothetical protein [Paenibacillus sanguinis]|uniref:hypothetical protein n=1 Tax=Paenibacillus sanguinis TaxID=225906 RepID=UPI000381FC4C|nr:hypothetical protein [Paenibacillus sanguinis]
MKNATVTVDYESFQRLKDRADRYEAMKRNQAEEAKNERKFIECICDCIEKANDARTPENKQYHIAQGIRAICEHYDMDLLTEYAGLDEGEAP